MKWCHCTNSQIYFTFNYFVPDLIKIEYLNLSVTVWSQSEQYMDDKVEELRRDHKEAMRRLVDEHEETLSGTIQDYETQISHQKDSYEVLIGWFCI